MGWAGYQSLKNWAAQMGSQLRPWISIWASHRQLLVNNRAGSRNPPQDPNSTRCTRVINLITSWTWQTDLVFLVRVMTGRPASAGLFYYFQPKLSIGQSAGIMDYSHLSLVFPAYKYIHTQKSFKTTDTISFFHRRIRTQTVPFQKLWTTNLINAMKFPVCLIDH